MTGRAQAWAWYLERNPSLAPAGGGQLDDEDWPPHLAVCEFYLENQQPHTRRCHTCWCHQQVPAAVTAEGR